MTSGGQVVGNEHPGLEGRRRDGKTDEGGRLNADARLAPRRRRDEKGY